MKVYVCYYGHGTVTGLLPFDSTVSVALGKFSVPCQSGMLCTIEHTTALPSPAPTSYMPTSVPHVGVGTGIVFARRLTTSPTLVPVVITPMPTPVPMRIFAQSSVIYAVGAWSGCSSSCMGGVKHRSVQCIHASSKLIVDSSEYDAASPPKT